MISKVVWRRAGTESPLTFGKVTFTPDSDIEVHVEEVPGATEEEDESRYNLVIKNVSQDQAGAYMCQVAATNNYTNNITLNVLG